MNKANFYIVKFLESVRKEDNSFSYTYKDFGFKKTKS